MSCDEAARLMACVAVNDPDLTAEEQADFAGHLIVCPACAEEYEESRATAELLKRHGTISEGTRGLLARAGYAMLDQRSGVKRFMTVQEGWEDLLQRCPDLAEGWVRETRRRRVSQMVRRMSQVAAMAACLAVVFTAVWLLPRGRGKSTSVASGRGYAELVTAGGREALALGQPIISGGERREIWLGGEHRVVMNRNTLATLARDSQGAYRVHLSRGELYVEVVPGHPFTVTTGNALLAITGTRFDVKAEAGRTELALLKGSVRFSSSVGGAAVDVTAGHASVVAGQAGPTAPVAADVAAATAWAGEAAPGDAIAGVVGLADDDVLRSMRGVWGQGNPADLETLDYTTWRDAHRDWFAGQFPWIFKAQAAMERSGVVGADYLDLLMISGDIWQFHYDSKLPVDQRLTRLEPTAMARLARHYGLDEQGLMRAAGVPDSMCGSALFSASTRTPCQWYGEAMRRWQDGLVTLGRMESEHDRDTMLFVWRASMHLANTRTAAYLWTRSHPREAKQVLAENRYFAGFAFAQGGASAGAEELWSRRLRQQAMAAQSSSRIAQELLTMPASSDCVSRVAETWRKLAATVADVLPESPVSLDR